MQLLSLPTSKNMVCKYEKGVIATGWVASRIRDNRLIADDDAVFLTFSILLSVTMRHLPVRRNAPLDQILAPADEENAQRTPQLSNLAKRTSHHAYNAPCPPCPPCPVDHHAYHAQRTSPLFNPAE